MDKSKLELYASYKMAIAEFEEKCDQLKPEILEMMESEEAEKVNTEFGSFTLTKNRKYTFSDSVEQVRTDLKEKEAIEKADGTATYEESTILKFTSKKNKKDISI